MALGRLIFALASLLLLVHGLAISPAPLAVGKDSALVLNNTNKAPSRLVATLSAPQINRTHQVFGNGASDPTLVHILADWDPANIPSNADWNRIVGKGAMLRCMMESTDEEAGGLWDPYERHPPTAASVWRGTLQVDLPGWGWRESTHDQSACNFENQDPRKDFHHRIADAFAGLGINIHSRAQGGDNMCYAISHGEDSVDYGYIEEFYWVRGIRFQTTGAYYQFGINPVAGAIFAQNLFGPIPAAKQNWDDSPSMDEMPALRLASDVIFAYWLREAPKPGILQYYFANHVVNKLTVQIVAKVLGKMGVHALPLWPGIPVRGESENGAALMGSPIGATLSFMLIQHKHELGIKKVSEMVIFRNHQSDKLEQLQLLFKIVNVYNPHGEPDEDVPMGQQDEVTGSKRQESRVEHGGVYTNGVRTHMLVW